MLSNVCFQSAFQLLLKLPVLAAVTIFGPRTVYALLLKICVCGVRCTANGLTSVFHEIRSGLKESLKKLIRRTADELLGPDLTNK